MKKQLKIYLILFACALLVSPSLFSQNQLFAVNMGKINFDKGGQFVKALKASNAIIKKDSKTPVYYNTFITETNQFMQVAPIKSFADLGKMTEHVGANNQLIGAELLQQGGEAMEDNHTSIVSLRNDLSVFLPKGTDVSDRNQIRWQHLYFHPKDAAKVYAIVKKAKAHWEQSGSEVIYYIYQPVFGADLNRVILVHQGTSRADFEAADAVHNAQLKNPEFMALLTELQSMITDIRIDYGWYRPDLSLLPAAVPQEK